MQGSPATRSSLLLRERCAAYAIWISQCRTRELLLRRQAAGCDREARILPEHEVDRRRPGIARAAKVRRTQRLRWRGLDMEWGGARRRVGLMREELGAVRRNWRRVLPGDLTPTLIRAGHDRRSHRVQGDRRILVAKPGHCPVRDQRAEAERSVGPEVRADSECGRSR